MKKKILGIFIVMLLIGTVVSAVGTMNIKTEENIDIKPVLTTNDLFWSDNFDSYDLGQVLDGTPDDGGWKLFDNGINNPWPGGGEIVNEQFRSEPHSLKIHGLMDILHEFTGLNSGNLTFTMWIYIPNEYLDGGLVAFSSYGVYGDPSHYQVPFLLEFDNVNHIVYDWLGGEGELPLITDQWVELRLEVNLEGDWCECYYNNELLLEGDWSSMGTGYGYRNFYEIGLGYGQSPIYYDDFSIDWESNGLEPDINGEGSFNWNVSAESFITDSFTLENIGDPGSWLEWKVVEFPDFGTWYCDPDRGMLKPEDGSITVEVRAQAPEDKNRKFTGDLKIQVIGNPDDEVIIPVTLTTPKSTSFSDFNPFIFRIIQRFSILEKLLL